MHKPSNDEILARIETILAEVLEIESVGVTAQTRLEEIEDLDSFGVITVFMSLEESFGVRFTTDEIDATKTIGDILEGISKKQTR